jgi:hypothetical protein
MAASGDERGTAELMGIRWARNVRPYVD